MFKWIKPHLEKWDAVAMGVLTILDRVSEMLYTFRMKGIKIRLDLHDNKVLDSWGLEDIEIFVTLGDSQCAHPKSKKSSSESSTKR